ncbi:MAG: ABC transporter permease subunit [Methanomassiliicoccus sp.]|nr:ABC transporter permease subunit [Methanomassiliicoccus sp.]
MRQFEVYLRKDLRLLISEAFLPIVVMLAAAICLIFAFFASNAYASSVHANYNWASYTPPSPSEMLLLQRSSLGAYWISVLSPLSLLILVVSCLSLTGERESGMVKYILTYRKGGSAFIASKFVTLVLISMMFSFISLLAYLLILSLTGGIVLGADALLISLVFPTLLFITLSSLGLFVSTLVRKKHVVAVAGVLIFLIITAIMGSVLDSGMASAQNEFTETHESLGMTNAQMRELFPSGSKMLVSANPMILQQGLFVALNLSGADQDTVAWGTFALYGLDYYLAYAAVATAGFFLAALISFRRERSDEHIVHLQSRQYSD